MNKEDKIQDNISFIVLNIILIGLVLVLFLMIYRFRVSHAKPIKEDLVLVDKKMFIDESKIKAKSVYILDLSSKKTIFSKNPDEILPLASLTKLMTTWTALSIMPREAVVQITKEDLSEEGDNGLLSNERWQLGSLLDYSLIVSSNDAMRSIASVSGAFANKNNDLYEGRKYFIKKMNEEAQKLGLNNLSFSNETGLDTDSYGGLGSSREIASLMVELYKKYPEVLELTKKSKVSIRSYDSLHNATNTNDIVNKIPNLIASKTGFTSKAGGNLALMFDVGLGRPVVIVVLGSTEQGRFSDMLYLASSTIDFISQ